MTQAQQTETKHAEHRPIATWFDTQLLALQVLANLENQEGDRLRRAGAPAPEHACPDEQSVDLEEARSLAPSLEQICIGYSNMPLSDGLDEAMHREAEQIADRIIGQLPQEELHAILAAARRHWDE